MSTRTNQIRERWTAVVAIVGYGLLALFMLFLAYMTYQYGGGIGDWKSVVTIAALTMVFAIVGWLTVTTWREQ